MLSQQDIYIDTNNLHPYTHTICKTQFKRNTDLNVKVKHDYTGENASALVKMHGACMPFGCTLTINDKSLLKKKNNASLSLYMTHKTQNR